MVMATVKGKYPSSDFDISCSFKQLNNLPYIGAFAFSRTRSQFRLVQAVLGTLISSSLRLLKYWTIIEIDKSIGG